MATAAAVPAADLERKTLENEIAGLRAQIADEQRTLARLTDERAKLIEAIGLKKSKPSAAVEIAAEIAGSESVLAGLNAIMRPKQARLDEVITQIRRDMERDQRQERRPNHPSAIEAQGLAVRHHHQDPRCQGEERREKLSSQE